jgi:hypothetical protein
MEKTDENEIYPYPGKTRSVVWDFFGFKKKHNVDGPPVKQNLVMETAICRKSGKSYANKGNLSLYIFKREIEPHSFYLISFLDKVITILTTRLAKICVAFFSTWLQQVLF